MRVITRIRLALHGCTNRPFYHVVVAANQFKRNGRHLEQVGSYDPMPNNKGEKLVALNLERMKYWISVGARPTPAVADLLGLAGLLPVHPSTYLLAQRNRKAYSALLKAKSSLGGAEGESSADTTPPVES